MAMRPLTFLSLTMFSDANVIASDGKIPGLLPVGMTQWPFYSGLTHNEEKQHAHIDFHVKGT